MTKYSNLRKHWSSDNVGRETVPVSMPETNAPQPVTEGRFTAPAAALLTFALVCVLYAVFRGPYILWNIDGRALAPAGSYVFAAAIVVAALGGLAARARGTGSVIHVSALCIGPLAVWASDWLCNSYSLFHAPGIRGELICAAVISFFILRAGWLHAFRWWLPFASVLLFWSFLAESGGQPLFSDDHASVFYRLTLLKEFFPRIPFYGPMWNAGYDVRDFFSTGILNLFLLSSPLLYFFRVEQVYNLLVGGVLFLVFPLSIYAAARSLRFERLSAAISAILGLSVSIVWYRWSLKYGSMGFVTSVSLLPLNIALAVRLLDEAVQIRTKEALLFVITFSLMLFWSISGVVFLPVVLFALARLRPLARLPKRKMVVALLLVVNLPWIAVWLRVANVFSFVLHPPAAVTAPAESAGSGSSDDNVTASDPRDDSPPPESRKRDRRHGVAKSKEFSAAKAVTLTRNFASNSNALLIFFGLPGILLLPGRRLKLITLSLAAWLLALGAAGSQIKPQLELERMFVILAVVLTLPAGKALSILFARASERQASTLTRLLASVPAAFVFVGVFCSTAVVRNRSVEQYFFTDDSVRAMTTAIQQYGGPGRVLFSGFVLHELNHGHIAPIAYYSGHPLIASSPVHNTWWYTDIIPESFRDAGPPEVERYLDLMNVTAVMAHEPSWRTYFESQPDRYRFVWEGARFKLYQRVSNPGNYFLEGSGEVAQQTNQIEITMGTAEAVVKFHHFPFLKSSTCTIAPYPISAEESLIKITDCAPGRKVTISAVGGFSRVVS
ncbi:MAG: hypothetical protein U0136_20675 [Bdellovibrionota bacterium]